MKAIKWKKKNCFYGDELGGFYATRFYTGYKNDNGEKIEHSFDGKPSSIMFDNCGYHMAWAKDGVQHRNEGPARITNHPNTNPKIDCQWYYEGIYFLTPDLLEKYPTAKNKYEFPVGLLIGWLTWTENQTDEEQLKKIEEEFNKYKIQEPEKNNGEQINV
jgi:hypothetical protein